MIVLVETYHPKAPVERQKDFQEYLKGFENWKQGNDRAGHEWSREAERKRRQKAEAEGKQLCQTWCYSCYTTTTGLSAYILIVIDLGMQAMYINIQH